MTEIPWVVKKIDRAGWLSLEVDSPVHEGRGASDSENDGAHVVHRDGLDTHGLGATPPVRRNMGIALGAFWGFVNAG